MGDVVKFRPKSDWKPWSGGYFDPIGFSHDGMLLLVDITLRGGDTYYDVEPWTVDWRHSGDSSDIVAYRKVKYRRVE